MPKEIDTEGLGSAEMESLRRRLGENYVPKETAEAACAKVFDSAIGTPQYEACVYDVMATGDLEMARAGAF